jgi:hypothetical protein
LRSLEEVRVPILRRVLAVLVATAAIGLWLCAGSAWAGAGSKIIEKCTNGESLAGFSQSAYREALKNMPTEVSEYSPCPNLIQKAELAAAGGGTSPATPTGAPNVPLPLTSSEQHAVQNAHHGAFTPIRVGSKPIRPGVVHANVASAVNTLPHSLFAMLAFILAAALALLGREVHQRVHARRDG